MIRATTVIVFLAYDIVNTIITTGGINHTTYEKSQGVNSKIEVSESHPGDNSEITMSIAN